MDQQAMELSVLEVLGRNIKRLRKEHAWTQEEFAEAANINDKEVSHIEAGNRNITIETLVKISSAFNVDPDFLLKDEYLTINKK